jgi:hypothetical protein
VREGTPEMLVIAVVRRRRLQVRADPSEQEIRGSDE